MATILARNTLLQRLIGAAALDSAIYEEVEGDTAALPQAFAIVIAASLAAGIGARGLTTVTVGGILLYSAIALVSWAAWALITFEIGARLMPEPQTRVDVGQLLRTIGFAATPGLLRILGVMPAVALPVFVVTSVWMLLAMIVAVRQALDYRTTRAAVAVCALGWVLAIAIAVVLGVLFGPTVSLSTEGLRPSDSPDTLSRSLARSSLLFSVDVLPNSASVEYEFQIPNS